MKRIFVAGVTALLSCGIASAQTNTVKSTREAYGVRLDAKAQPNNVNTARINSRIDSRIDNRLALRLERYRIGQAANPTAAFATKPDDKSRTAPKVTAPLQADPDQ